MNDKSYLNRPVVYKVFNRKELPTNKKVDLLKKYRAMDAFDQDRNFWNMMSSPLSSDRGYYSRKIPITPLTWKHDKIDAEELALLGDLKKRPLKEVVDEVRELTTGICVENGFVDLRKIEWNPEFQAEEIEEINSIKDQKYKRIEVKEKNDNSDLIVKK